MTQDIEQLSINTIRTLSMDAVQKANSGHPGAPMGLAPAAYVLWQRHLEHNPDNPEWIDRDRFVLSNGHASMLLYSLLHLTGYESMSLDEIKNFRQWGSLTPGHPEAELTPGVETTTGPLGQGFANAVGMALAEAHLHDSYDGVVDHFTYVFCSDGDLMEGISHEAASLAGHLGLGKLVYIYDDNEITIDGRTDITYSEDVTERFESYDWQVLTVADENDLDAIDDAITAAKEESDKPTLIRLETTIGYGSPNKADTSSAHGAPLGDEEIEKTKERLDWPYDEAFTVPDEVRDHMTNTAVERGAELQQAWSDRLDEYARNNPEQHEELTRRIDGELPAGWSDDLPGFEPSDKGMATRKAGGAIIEKLYDELPELVGGSADLAGSNKTLKPDFGVIDRGEFDGQNMHFGIREHAMAAMVNGMCLHGGVRGFGATFLVFSDYMRPSLRLAALMGEPSMMVFTHDSIGLGEDGPTHQPVEHLMSLRAMPNYQELRPGDANEVRDCWEMAIERDDGPSGLILTRQGVPVIDKRGLGGFGDAKKGAYALADNTDADGDPEAIIMATGSEVAIALEAWRNLTDDGITARLVSMPSWSAFEEQDQSYRDRILPPDVDARVSIEAGVTLGWERWIGSEGVAIGVDRFGASAPYQDIYENLGLTADRVEREVRDLLDE